MAIVCEIQPEQKDLLFKAVASDLLAMIEEGKKFSLSGYVKDMFNLLQENGMDVPTSIAYASLVPSNIKRLYGLDEAIDDLISEELPLLHQVAKKIKDTEYALDYLGLKPTDLKSAKELEREAEAKQKKTNEELSSNANKNGKVFSAKPNSLNTTTGNSKDLDKAFTYAFLDKIVTSEVIASENSGYYITLMDAAGLITPADSLNKSNYKGLVQVISDKDGNPIYFDEAYNHTTRELGKLVFFRLRGGQESFDYVLKGLQTMDELLRTTGYANEKAVLDNIKAEHELALKKKKYVEGGPGRKIVQHITGASRGFLLLSEKSEKENIFDLSKAPDLSGGSIFIDVIDVDTAKQRYYFLRDFNNSSSPVPFITNAVSALDEEFLSKAADVILGEYVANGKVKKITDVDGDSENENLITYRQDFLYTFFGNNRNVKLSKEGEVYVSSENGLKKLTGDVEESKKILLEALKYNPLENKNHSLNVLQLTSNSVPFFKQVGNNLAIDQEGMSEVEYKRFIQKNAKTSAKIKEDGTFQEENGYFMFRTPVTEINKIDSAEIEIPTAQKRVTQPPTQSTGVVKTGVDELFSSNPELANQVYEALGIINTSEVVLEKPKVNPDNFEATSYPIKINGKSAGVISVDDQGYISSSIGMAGVELDKDFQGKGYGTKVYIALAKELAKKGKTLKSEAFGKSDINEAANRVWTSLLNKGLAKDKGNYYELDLTQQEQQAKQLYSQYLDSIFPDSKVKDIVYHGTSNLEKVKSEGFNKSKLKSGEGTNLQGAGFYFAKFKQVLSSYAKGEKGGFIQAIVNLKNPLQESNFPEFLKRELNEDHVSLGNVIEVGEKVDKWLNTNKKDGVVWSQTSSFKEGTSEQETAREKLFGTAYNKNQKTLNAEHYSVKEPEQIHILGSKQDIEGFKEFVAQPSIQPVSQVETTTESNPVPTIEDISSALNDEFVEGGLDINDLIEPEYKAPGKLDDDETFNKLVSQIDNAEAITQEQIQAAIDWWNSKENVLRGSTRLIESFENINPENPQSIATFTRAGITLFKGSNYTELYHEAWHAFTQRFLTKAERNKLYSEVKKMSGSFVDFNGKTIKFSDPNITDKQIEEYLAEDFRKFMLSGGKGVSEKTPVKKSIFQTILDILKILFGYSLTDQMSNMQASFNLNDYYNNLRTGQNIRTTPIGFDADFEVLNKINPISPKYQNLSDSLSYSDAMTIVDSIDSFFSEHEDQSNRINGNSEFTSTILSSAKERANAYNGFLLRCIKEYKAVVQALEKAKTENSAELPAMIRKKKLLEFTIANFSSNSTKGQSVSSNDIISAASNNLGVIAYHMQKSKYLNFDERFLVEDIEEKRMNDKDGYGHRAGNEKSMRELADDEVLYTIRSLFKYENGVPVKNELGFNKLMDFDEAWNKVQRVLENIYDIDNQYVALEKAADTDPMFAQLISKMGNPNRFSNSEFSTEDKNSKENMRRILMLNNLWTKFHNSFNGKRIPLVQLTVDLKAKNGVISGIEIKPGKAQASINKIARDWESNFSNPTVLGSRQRFINFRPQVANESVLRNFKGNTLNIPEIIKEFKDTHANNPIPFLRVFGMEIPETPEMKKLLTDTLKIFPRSIMRKLIYINNYNAGNPNDAIEIGSIEQLVGLTYENYNEEATYKELLEKVLKYSDKYGDTMVSTASGSSRWELSLRSTISQQIDALNNAIDFDALISDPKMSHLDPKRNPFVEGTIIATEIFGSDLSKKELSKKVSGREAMGKLELLNSSGVTMLVNNAYTGLSIDSAEADEVTQSLHNFYSYMLYGVSEATRHADKATSYWYKMRFRDGRKHYIPISSFASYKKLNNAKEDILETSGMQTARKQFLKYISAEVSRMYKLRNGDISGTATVGDKTYAEVGSDFTNMEDVLPTEIKNTIKKSYLSNNFFEQMMNPKTDNDIKLRNDIERAIDNYLVTQADKFKSDVNNTGIFNSDLLFSAVRKEVLGKNASAKILLKPESYQQFIDESAIMGYIVNDWIQKYETTVLFYGDPALYNHLKEEFHKRNPGIASTGTIPRSDESMNRLLNEVMPRRYADSAWYKGYDKPNKKETKQMSTAILEDVEAQSVYFDEYLESVKKSEAARLGVKKLSASQEKDVEAALKDYKKMTTGDGQGWITFDAYRSLLFRLGKWSPEQEDLYNDILAGKDVAISKVNRFFNVKKMQYWGPLAEKYGLPLQAFHKFSLMPLIPTLIKGTNLEKLHNKMVSQGIDYATFKSGSKINSITKDGSVDKFYKDRTAKDTTPAFINDDYEFTPNNIFIEYLKDQVETSDEFKGQIIFSTQLRKLVEIGLMENGVPTDFMPKIKNQNERRDKWEKALAKGETTSNYEKLVKYEGLIGKLTEYKKRELIRDAGIQEANGKITLSEKLLEFVKNELTRQELAEHEIDFIKYDPVKKSLVYDLSYHPSADKIERLLVTLVYKRLIRQKVNGEPLVQVSGAGFEPAGLRKASKEEQKKYGTNFLPFYKQNEDGSTSAMKVKIAIQGDFKKLLRHPDVVARAKELNISKLDALNMLIKDETGFLSNEENRKMITISGVRIPVQGLNSMEFAEVYEFLPENAGNMIILPSEIVAKSGSDFDIDKLTMMFPSIISTRKGVSLVKYSRTDENNLQENKKTLEEKYLAKDVVTDKLLNLIYRNEENESFKVKDEIRDAINSLKLSKQELKEEMAVLELESKTNMSSTAEIDSYYNQIIEINDQLDELFEGIFQVSAAAKKIQKEELDPINQEIDDLKVAIASGTSKGIENEILESVVDILKLNINFTDFITPNSTDLLKPIAKKYSQYVRDYDSYDTVSNEGESYLDENGKKRISGTRIFELGYNRFKHVSNNVGKKTLGMGAVDNTYNAIFNRIGFYMSPSFSITVGDDEYLNVDQKIRMPHNTIKVKGKDAISLAGLYDVNNKNSIATVISQMINGWVDVAKDSWIFDIQGNSEISPSLLFLIQAGVPVEQAIAFVSQPMIREYVKQQRFNKGTFSVAMGSSEEQSRYYRTYARLKMLNKMGVSVPKFVQDKPTIGMKNFLYADLMPTVLTDTGYSGTASENAFSLEELDKNIMGQMSGEEKTMFDIQTFLHFLEIEDMASATTQIKLGVNFDTSKTKSLYESNKKFAKSLSIEGNDRLPEGIKEKIEKSSPIGSFNIQPFTLGLVGNFFNLRASKELQSFLSANDNESFRRKMPGAFRDSSQYLSALTNDFTSFLFQQDLYNADRFDRKADYKGAKVETKIESTKGLNRAVFVKKEKDTYVMYVDFDQMELDFKSGIYSKEEYRTKFGYSPVESNLFSHADPDVRKNLYYQYIYERESLRQMIPFSEFKKTRFFDNITKSVKKTFRKSKEQTQEEYDKELGRRGYEDFLKQTALLHKINIPFIMKNKSGYANQVMAIEAMFPGLKNEYKLLSSLQYGNNGNSKNLKFTEYIMTEDLLNMYNEDLEKLSNVNVIKSTNKLENQLISNLFSHFTLFSLLQSGQDTKGIYSLGKIVDPVKSAEMIRSSAEKFNKLSSDDKITILKKYLQLFIKQHSVAVDPNDQYAEQPAYTKKRIKEYYGVAKLKGEVEKERSEDLIEVDNVTPDLVTYNLGSGSGKFTKVVENLKKWAASSSTEDNLLVFDDAFTEYKTPVDVGGSATSNVVNSTIVRDMVAQGLIPAEKTYGMKIKSRGSMRTASDFTLIDTPEKLDDFMRQVDTFVEELLELQDNPNNPKVLIFNKDGHGLSLLGYGKSEKMSPTDKMLKKVPQGNTLAYKYLSEKLYENFGFINPGYLEVLQENPVSNPETIKISNEEVEEIIYECFYS